MFKSTAVSLLLAAAPLLAAPGGMLPSSFKDTARQVKSSVVNISTVKNVKGMLPFGGGGTGDPFFDRFFGGQGGGQREQSFKTRSLGSGVIIDAMSGYVLTNNHVVEDADEIKVKLSDKRELDGEIVGRDPKTDLAVVKLKNASNLQAAPFGDSDAIEVGDWVLAVGSPFGLEQTVSHGIISAKGRVIGQGPYDDFLQTDAPINPGNSGGPLVNLNGEVVGINTAISSRSGGSEGIGFAIPASVAKKIYANLIKDGKVTRGWLGVQIQELEPALAKYFSVPEGVKGVVIADVMPEGPARKAGLKAGDLVTEFNGQKVEGVRELQRLVAEAPVGQPMPLKVYRDKGSKALSIKIGNMADFDAESSKSGTEKARAKLGLGVRTLSPTEAAEAHVEGGVVVEELEQGSPAEDAGIQQGDVILELDKARISSAEEFSRLAKKIQAGDTAVLRVSRGGRSLYLSLRLPEGK